MKTQKPKNYILETSERPLIQRDPEAFIKTETEVEDLARMKRQNVEARRKEFGSDYKKHLNSSKNQRATDLRRY